MISRPMRVMSFNIRGSFRRGDGINAWENRAALNVAAIERHAPDLVGFQELQSGNLKVYRERLAGYSCILGPRAGNGTPHEFNAIFFDPARLRMLDSGGFWLSTTPESYSSSWRARVVRSATWARFAHLDTGRTFVHVNTHLDHLSGLARAEGSRLILRNVEELEEDGLPTVLTGDFNCIPGSLPYRRLLEDGFRDTFRDAGHEDNRETGTFHGFGRLRYRFLSCCQRICCGGVPMRIDWILLKDPGRRFRTGTHMIVRDRDAKAGVYPSDHYPVLAELAVAG